MPRLTSGRLALVISVIALFFAADGPAFAATLIGTKQIADNAITAPKIATNAVGVSEIATNGVGAAEIGLNSVGSSEIGPNAVGSSEIANDAVTGSEVKNGSISADDLSFATVQTCTGLGAVKFVASIDASAFTIDDVGVWRSLDFPSAYGFAVGCGGFGSRVKKVSDTEFWIDSGNLPSGTAFFDSGYAIGANASSNIGSSSAINAMVANSGTDGGVLIVYTPDANVGFSAFVY